MVNGGESPPEVLVVPEPGLSLEKARKSHGEPEMGSGRVDLVLSRSSLTLEKLNQRLVRSDCGSAMVGTAGDVCLDEEDEELMSKSTNVEKSLGSRTKGEGSSGLSSNMTGCGSEAGRGRANNATIQSRLVITSVRRLPHLYSNSHNERDRSQLSDISETSSKSLS